MFKIIDKKIKALEKKSIKLTFEQVTIILLLKLKCNTSSV